jgi:hypothetical protein
MCGAKSFRGNRTVCLDTLSKLKKGKPEQRITAHAPIFEKRASKNKDPELCSGPCFASKVFYVYAARRRGIAAGA